MKQTQPAAIESLMQEKSKAVLLFHFIFITTKKWLVMLMKMEVFHYISVIY